VIDLGTLPGGHESFAVAINASGEVAGYASTGETHSHAFFWTRTGGIVDLGTLGGNSSYATGLSASGEVVGYAETAAGKYQAFSWTQAGGMIDLGTLGGCSDAFCSIATGINAHGEVVGYAQTPTGSFHAFSWTATGGIVDLGTLGGSDSDAYAINDSGQIVGSSQTSTEETHAFSWTPEHGMSDLGTLSGNHYSKATLVNALGDVAGQADVEGFNNGFFWTPESGGLVDIGTLDKTAFSEASGMSDTGQVVGVSWVQEASGTRERAFSWTKGGGIIELGTLPGGDESRAVAVNGAGEVVGSSGIGECPPCAAHAFSWIAHGGLVDLGTLGGASSAASAINEAGAIAGSAQNAEADSHAAVWNLPPAPAVAGVKPRSGPTPGGTSVVITGTNLEHVTSVMFGTATAASFDVISGTEITATSPPGTGTVNVTVTSPQGTSAISAADRFTYVPPPTVTGLSPKTGPASGGNTVTITGTNFTGATRVDFGSTPAASFEVDTPTSITAIAPASTARTVDVTVTTHGGTSATTSKDHYKFGPPTVTAVSPKEGPEAGDTEVTVSGSGFALGKEATAFTFGSTAVTRVDCTSTTTCTVTVPSHRAGTVEVKAAVGGQRSLPNPPFDEYTYE
jgi:probable HAF family extracellular repeat protein